MLSALQISDRDPLVGALLDGRYHVTGVLGRGGMGIVYEGLQQPLGRAVAIKVLGHNTARDPVVVARFLREARFASGLAHGNIVDVSDLGRLPDGRPYLVMPKVAGIDFATLMEREAPMAPARVANLLRGVAAALDLVHAKGLVHRDVKPENLMHVLHADGSETVMLLDFGLAALLPGNAARLTADDMMCGSPAYMAPELIATGSFDRRADVYALATVAFELLTGRLPFDDELPTCVMMTKVSSAAPALSHVVTTRFSEEIEHVIARGLARDPSERYASAGEFVAELESAALPAEGLLGDFTHDLNAAAVSRGHAEAAYDSMQPAESMIRPLARRSGSRLALAAVTVAAVCLLLAWMLVPSTALGPRMHPARVAISGTAPALRGGAISGTAPALRGGAINGTAPALRGGASFKAPSNPVIANPVTTTVTTPRASARLGTELEAANAPVQDAPAQDAPVQEAAPRRATSGATVHQPRRPRPIALHAATNIAANETQPSTPLATASGTDTLTLTANHELLEGHLARAVELFQDALQRDPHDLVALRGLGLASERLGRTSQAVAAYRSALALEPNTALAPKLRDRLERLGAAP